MTATAPQSSTDRIRLASMLAMRARVWAVSVRMPIWAPVNDRAE